MSIQVSPIASSIAHDNGSNFFVRRLELEKFENLNTPIQGLDHFYMTGPTFAPHPHAGFSAISYIFQDSVGKLRNRDSLGNDFLVEAGELVWSQAGTGIIHDETPAIIGQTVHGIQLFINLTSKNKHIEPYVFHLKNEEISIYQDDSNNYIRVLSGNYKDIISVINPVEELDFLDISLSNTISYTLKSNWNLTIYLMGGSIDINSKINNKNIILNKNEAISIQSSDEEIKINFLALIPDTHFLIIAGPSQYEPVATYGPFIMNTETELKDAYDRYRFGRMGRLSKL